MAPIILMVPPHCSDEEMDISPSDEQGDLTGGHMIEHGIGLSESAGMSDQEELSVHGRTSSTSAVSVDQSSPAFCAASTEVFGARVPAPRGRSSLRDLSVSAGRSMSREVLASTKLSSQIGRSTPAGLLAPKGRSAPTGLLTPTMRSTPTGLLTPSGRSTPTGLLTPAGRSTPTGILTPTGRSTPTGLLTPTGRSTPTQLFIPVENNISSSNRLSVPTGTSDFRGATDSPQSKRTLNFTKQIHYHNLENVSVLDLYHQQNCEMQSSEGYPGNSNNVNELQVRDIVTVSAHNDNCVHRYKSRSCPHSRHHSPVRQRQKIETVKEMDNSEEGLAAIEDISSVFSIKDINYNDNIYINVSSEENELCQAFFPTEARSRGLDNVSFASLFNRCRFERDTSATNTPHEGDARVVDPDQLMRRVNYFLCAERVSQMTRSYDNDIEAVTHLLEEKERDLELAARIGQTLLSKNRELSSRLEALEDQLNVATEKVNQLQHELGQKDGVIRYYSEVLEHDPMGEEDGSRAGLPLAAVDVLENKIKLLEDENFNLRQESVQLKAQTESYEQREKKLLENCMQQLAEVNHQLKALDEELHEKAEESTHHKEESTKLLVQITDLQKKISKMTVENVDVREQLAASLDCQHKLTSELSQMQDKYDELFEMLEEARSEVRLMRSRDKTSSSGRHSGYAASTDSLASELEASLQQELSQSSGRTDNWRVFETARAVKQAGARSAQRDLFFDSRMSLAQTNQWDNDSQGPSLYFSDVESVVSDGCSVDMDSLYGHNPELGQPGIPGTSDLESALKRISLRRTSGRSDKSFQEEEERRKKHDQTDMTDATLFSQKNPMLHGPRSRADSVSSTGTSVSTQRYRLPEKLQIVKPLEGSMTLRQWQHLATPHLGGIFEERDGVQIKGESKIDLSEDICSVSDVEDGHSCKDQSDRKQSVGFATFTTNPTTHVPTWDMEEGDLCSSSINRPLEHTSTKGDTQADSASTSNADSQHASSQHRQETDGPYSMTLGLAALLQERESPGQARIRFSASKKMAKTSELSVSLPSMLEGDLNQTFLSPGSYESQPLSSSTPKIFVGDRSFEVPVREVKERKNLPGVETETPKKLEPSSSRLAGGFLQQIKSKGYSLYDMWMSGGRNHQPDSENSTGGASVAGDGSTAATKATAEPGVADGGVLGAITNFRRRGMF